MIDPDLIDNNPVAREGFKLLAESGIFREQIAAEESRILHGSEEQPVNHLANEIKKFRMRAGILESLHSLGEELKRKESER